MFDDNVTTSHVMHVHATDVRPPVPVARVSLCVLRRYLVLHLLDASSHDESATPRNAVEIYDLRTSAAKLLH